MYKFQKGKELKINKIEQGLIANSCLGCFILLCEESCRVTRALESHKRNFLLLILHVKAMAILVKVKFCEIFYVFKNL